MDNLPVYNQAVQPRGMSLARQRDILHRLASENLEAFRGAVEELTVECVFQTLRLTGSSLSRLVVSEVASGHLAAGGEVNLVEGQFQAIGLLEREARAGRLFVPELVSEVHRLSTPGSTGAFRTAPLEGKFSTARPSRPEFIADKVSNLCDWLAVESGRRMYPPEKAALAFARLLEISPFDRGNFRTAHLLLNYFAFLEGYPPLFLLMEEAEAVREEVERAMAFETAPLVERLSLALGRSLTACLKAVGQASAAEEPPALPAR